MAEHKKPKKNHLAQILIVVAVFAAIAWVMDLVEQTESATAGTDPVADPAGGNGGDPGQAGTAADGTVAGPWTEAGYVLQFGPDFKPGLASVDDLGIAVVLAVDVSGSMEDPPARGLQEPKYIQAARTLGQILDFLERLGKSDSMKGLVLKVGIIGFYAEVETIAPLTVMDQAGFAALRQIAANPQNFEPGGRTAIGLALERGAEMLAQSGTIFKSLIVVSDGENTEGVEPGDVLKAINENRNNRSTPDVPVSTRGTLTTFVGFDIDAGLFAPLSQIGARVSAAADQAELRQALEAVLMADISRLEKAAE